MATPNPPIPNILSTPELGVELASGPARPLVLFPVRLETRFVLQAADTSELRVRVYPDTIHNDSHEPELTVDELTWGKHFWGQMWRAAGNEDREKAAWRQLADRLDPQRAAWVARTLKPLNPEDRPQNPIGSNQALPKPVRFPSPELKEGSWTRAPHTYVLPDCWTLLGYKDGRLVVNVTGEAIDDPLATGPNPSSTANVDESGIDEDMRWMVDFASAETKGMGIRVKLSQADAAAGFDFLLVIGIKNSLEQSAQRLSDLFNAHHYTDGLGFIRQGTPSNNTQDAPSGFSSSDSGHEASYLAELREPPAKPSGTDGDRLTHALGLRADPVFANVPNAAITEQLDARQMNTALWQATWGYFLLQMLGSSAVGGESPLSESDIAWVRNHFIQYVRAGGPLPAIRVGTQPYGVLPVTSLTAWKSRVDQGDEINRDKVLHGLLLKLREIWRRNIQDVPRLGRTDEIDGNGLDKDLPEVLSIDALSSSYSVRQLLGRHYLDNLLVFLSGDFFLDVWGLELPDIPPMEEPPPIEDPPEDLAPRFRAQWIRQQQTMRVAFIRQQEAIQRNAIRARQEVINRINAKRGAVPEWWAAQERLTATVLGELGITWKPRMAHAVFSTATAPLNGTLVQADGNQSLSPNYIESLLALRDLAKEAWFQGDTFEQPVPHTLLHLLLRHSMLLEYASAASHLLIKQNLLTPGLQHEPELLSMQPSLTVPTIWERLKTNIVLTEGSKPVGQYLINFSPSGEPDVAREPDLKHLSEFRASLAHLKSLDVDMLEQLMIGTLDLCSHRLDAWITSFATKRLEEMRQSDPTGVLLGGYGWVMNLRPAEPQAQAPTPPGEQAPVFEAAKNPGFVHTPSLTQAATVAILRSGHLAQSSSGTVSDLLAIDLSSERVRLATWLLDGVRQGQPLGALLGYRFERRLQEIRKAQFISVFRELAPLVARKLEPGQQTASVESLAANNVVDGLALMRRWEKGKEGTSTSPSPWTMNTIPFGQMVNQKTPVLPPFDPNNADFEVLKAELDLLEQAVDAVSDALMAESVHQVVRGNPFRAASTVESVAGGETPPPELEVVKTPRTGIALTHRVVSLFSGEPQLPTHWSARSPRANAEPQMNAWAARLLPNPAHVRCLIEHLDPVTGKVLEIKEIRLDQLGQAPLDYVHAIEGGKDGQQAEIEQRLLLQMMTRPGGFAAGSLLRVNAQRMPEWSSSELSYGEFREALRTTKRLLTNVRALDGEDLNPPDRTAEFSVDMEELNKRASAAVTALQETLEDFNSQVALPGDLNELRELILRASAFGIAGAVPLSAGDSTTDRQVLMTQAASIQKELVQRKGQLEALAAPSGEDRLKHAISRLQIVFGKAFIVLPRFRLANIEELEKALADSDKVQGSDPLVAPAWFQRMARVRDGMSHLSAALSYSEALNTGEKLKLKIVQLPYAEGDRWVALPLVEGRNIPGGKLSIAVQSSADLNVRKALAGVLIDEWVEVVPSTTETTGIALQYDRPNAAPPQTILIAVPPEMGMPWTIWSLQQLLLETLDLARIRAVDPVTLDEVGHYLPALYFAYNTLGDAVSTDFTTVK
ncbi:MAG: hypothetical protein AB7L09_17840 [Nitrospira sp.]